MNRIALAFTFLFCMMLNASAGGFGDGFGAGSGTFLGGTVPNATTFSGNVRIDGTLDQRGAISNGGSATCNGVGANSVCFSDADGITIAPTTGSTAVINMKAIDTAAQAGNVLYNSANAAVGGLRYYGSTSIVGAAAQNKTAFFAQGTAAGVLIGHGSTDVAAGTQLVGIYDGSNFANLLAAFDGAGNLLLASGATRSRGTITLAAGTGTATVASGTICTCTDTTAVAAVRCVVASTTLTATGTGTDVIAYHCL